MKSTTKLVLGAAFGGLALSVVSTAPASALEDLNVITANNAHALFMHSTLLVLQA